MIRACAAFAGTTPSYHYKTGMTVRPGTLGEISGLRPVYGGIVVATDPARDVVYVADSDWTAAILSNAARGITPQGRLDWTDAAGCMHRVRCVRIGNAWSVSDRAEPAQAAIVAAK